MGDAHSTREAAFVGSWAMAFQEGVLEDFPELGSALVAAPLERCPHVQALVEAWASVAQWVPATTLEGCAGGGAGHTEHGSLACLRSQCPVQGAQDASGARSGRFASHLQRRLMKNSQLEALEDMYDDASQAWQRSARQQDDTMPGTGGGA